MPIYAYRCESCGHSLDALQKVSDAPLRDCPACGAAALHKQVTAAGFQLKGSGWYATDFKGGSGASTADKSAAGAAAPAAATAAATPTAGESAPAASCGASCACH
ncbi:FmdB family zinc ribbon protein [Thiomonas sp. FB-6]|uniref:FmdB family zinc ribbon protein n=1 Tax=Thiomonas sp. FB-6 TaxID=1158291 RepID=UPI00036F8CFE|nr:FmdB family zinc ribbon protein [Thiomonas sp. FB-6]